ncbi:MAG: MotA/TolQ/ExbB proton channel family protein [Candidatus Paracaedibacter sp.]
MSYIHRYFLRMLTFLSLMGGIIIMLHQPLLAAFRNNIPLNTVILMTLSLGIGLVFYRLYGLRQEQLWFESYQKGEERYPGIPAPKILLPLSLSLGESQQKNQLSTIALRSILSSVESRLEETRDVSRYMIGLLIFLGLLGTFWGLSQTIGAIAGVITGLEVDASNVKDSFHGLKQGLQAPLMGMGTAFSTSMFGLAGSLILGFLDLQVGKAAGSFYHNLEDHLTTIVKSTGDITAHAPTHSGPAYLQGLLEQTVECMAQLQNIMNRNEDNRSNVLQSLHGVGEKMSMLTEQMVSQQVLLKKMAQGHVDLQKQLENLTAITSTPAFQGKDDGIKQYLRNLDATTLRLLEELIEGRARGIQELRGEIRLVARTISALAEQEAA